MIMSLRVHARRRKVISGSGFAIAKTMGLSAMESSISGVSITNSRDRPQEDVGIVQGVGQRRRVGVRGEARLVLVHAFLAAM